MTDLVMTGATPDEVAALVRRYHYSGRPAAIVHYAFAWRQAGGLFGHTGESVAGVTYSQPVQRNFPADALELSRLVRSEESAKPLSRFVAWSLRWLRANTDRPFVLAYADTGQGHHGGIYQACEFTYVGSSKADHVGFAADDGSFIHGRSCNRLVGTQSIKRVAELRPDWTPVFGAEKHLYIFPLRQRLNSILHSRGWKSLPYPTSTRGPSIGRPGPAGVSREHTSGAAP